MTYVLFKGEKESLIFQFVKKHTFKKSVMEYQR